MRTTQLEYFASVARNLSFTKASEECHVAQPAISQQIQALEAELGFKLLNRSTKGVTLTNAGRTYYHEATGIIEALKRSAMRAQAVAEGSAGTLVVGVSNSGQTAIFDAIRAFGAQYPSVDIRLKRSRSREQFHQLDRGEYDIFLTATICAEGRDDVGFVGEHESALTIAVGRSHPLANARRLSIEDLKGFAHIIADNEDERLLFATYPYLASVANPEVIRAEDQGIALAAMLLGLGIEAMPEEVSQTIHEDFAVCEVEGYDARLSTGWAFLKGNDNPALLKFIEFAKGAL